MSTAFFAQVGYLLGLFYFLSELALALVRRAKPSAGPSDDRGSLRLIWVLVPGGFVLATVLTLSLPQLSWRYIPAVQILGILLLLGGLALRWYAILYLGRYFTVNVAVATDHRLVDSGPYRLVRHPSYTGALIALLGTGIGFGNIAALLVITVCCFVAFAYRIGVEEQALMRGLGAPYRAYMERTKRLIPGVY